MQPLPAPPYTGPPDDPRPRVGLAVESMRRHMTNEGWELFAGLESAGYLLAGHGLPYDETDLPGILFQKNPGTVVAQDSREWLGMTADRSRNPAMRFRRIEALRERDDVWKATVIKDAQADQSLHIETAHAMGIHCWICYYHPDTVCRIAPFLRREHMVRTFHTLNPADVPPYKSSGRKGCILSGALGSAYPLRTRLAREVRGLPETTLLSHPTYRTLGCRTPEYLRTLARYKVAICTASKYAYALRKIQEATAAGCIVVTDLPASDPLPVIDGNLVRVDPGIQTHHLAELLERLYEEYDPERQEWLAHAAKTYFDFRAEGVRLAIAIEAMRSGYSL